MTAVSTAEYVDESPTTALVPVSQLQPQTLSMIRPLASIQDAKDAIDQYEKLKAAIQRDGDVFNYQGRPFLKKRFWTRLSTVFGLSVEPVSEERGFTESGALFYRFYAKASAPNGRYWIADGYCDRDEKGHREWPEHTVRATALTRASNRAISNLVGGGEVSADELVDYDDDPRPQPQQKRTITEQKPTPKPEQKVAAAIAETKAKVAAPEKSVDDLTATAEKELKERALALGFTPEQYDKSRAHHGSFVATAKALNDYEAKMQAQAEPMADESGESTEALESTEPAAGKSITQKDWNELYKRGLKAHAVENKADWDELLERTGGSYEDTLALVERFEKHDLQMVPALDGTGRRN